MERDTLAHRAARAGSRIDSSHLVASAPMLLQFIHWLLDWVRAQAVTARPGASNVRIANPVTALEAGETLVVPNIQVMNWNIQTLGMGRATVDGLCEALASVIVGAATDVCIIVELAPASGPQVMQKLAKACEHAWRQSVADATPGTAPMKAVAYLNADPFYRYFVVSHPNGSDSYGCLIRDIRAVRPMSYTPAAAASPEGSRARPLLSIHEGSWTTWPAAFPAAAPASPVLPGPLMPLVAPFVTIPLFRAAANRSRFAGTPPARGFFAGIGSRFPGLFLLEVQGAAAATRYCLAVVVLHAAAGDNASGTRNAQTRELCQLHISQLFGSLAVVARTQGYIHANGAWRAVDNLAFTGDFNTDFLAPSAKERAAIDALTADVANGGSQNMPAGGAASAPPGAAPPLAAVAPAVPSGAAIGSMNLTLAAAITQMATFMPARSAAHPPPPYARNGFDNFFYGGVQGPANPAAGADTGIVIMIPERLVPPVDAARPAYDVRDLAKAYYRAQTHGVDDSPRIRRGQPPFDADRLIGARLMSDHLPVLLTFQCP